MGLTFINKGIKGPTSSTSSAGDRLTAESIRFLNQQGFTVTDYGHTGYKKRANIRRNDMGEGVSHPHTLRFIEIGNK